MVFMVDSKCKICGLEREINIMTQQCLMCWMKEVIDRAYEEELQEIKDGKSN